MVLDGDRLSELRKDKGLTQDGLGEIIQKGKGSVSRYEKGDRLPDAETLKRLADFFHVSVDYLLGRTKFPKVLEQMPGVVLVDDLPKADAAKVEEYAALLRAERAKGK